MTRDRSSDDAEIAGFNIAGAGAPRSRLRPAQEPATRGGHHRRYLTRALPTTPT